jgi:SagB-type dehydrogenase family enzyme
MNMKPFIDPQVGVSGLKPTGWKWIGPGLWIGPDDEPFFFQRGIPNMTAEQIKTGLIPMYDLPRLQERTGRHKTASLQWDLYRVETKDSNGDPAIVDAALAQSGKWAFIVLLAATTNKHEQLHAKVFLPALNALTPIHTGAEAARIARQRAKQYAETVRSFRDMMKANLTVASDWVSDQMKGMPMPPSRKAIDPDAKPIALPKPDAAVLKKADLRTCIADRKSRRKYNQENLTLAELSYLLWATQGVRKEMPTGRHYRTVPSAGARHSFETYLVIQHVEGVKTGVYRYLPFDHQIVLLFTAENLAQKMTALGSGQPFVGDCAACFIWSSIPYRMEWRYGHHSERVILMDVGHVCQNLYLAAESIDCGTCGVAAYEQVALDEFLGLDGSDEFVIYLAPVGRIGKGQED